jgi:hypothetical protein
MGAGLTYAETTPFDMEERPLSADDDEFYLCVAPL